MAERSRWQNFALIAGPLGFAALLALETPLSRHGESGAPAVAAALVENLQG